MMSSKNNGFTASDIERYHSGKMSPQERHALEKAALDDPFLADALEGYAFTSTPEADLSIIQSRLDDKLHQKKAVPLFTKFKWLSVAAIVLVIAGTAWFAYIISKPKNPAIAERKQNKTKESSNDITPNQNVTSSDSATFTTTAADSRLKKENQTASKPTTKSVDVAVPQKPGDDVALTRSKAQAVSGNKEQVFLKTETISPTQNPVASIPDEFGKSKAEKLSESRSVSPDVKRSMAPNVSVNQTFSKDDSASPNPEAGKVKGVNDSTIDLNVTLHPLPMDSPQVVVVGRSLQKKSNTKYPQVIIDTLEPAEGFVNFDDYIASNLKMPEALKDKPVEGEVQLSFDVDQNGKPVNIMVVKSLCQKCDEEAIRLLKEGPKWKKKKNKKGKITLKF